MNHTKTYRQLNKKESSFNIATLVAGFTFIIIIALAIKVWVATGM